MPDQVIEFEGTRHSFPDDFTSADIAKALNAVHPPNPARHRSDSLGGPLPNSNPGWGDKFAEGATRGLLENPGGINSFLHPIDSLMGLPGMAYGLATGDPETYGGLASGAPFMLMGGGAPDSVGTVLKGGVKGALKGATAPSDFKFSGLPLRTPGVPATVSGAALGAEAGHFMPDVGPWAGAALGAAVPAIKGAYRGGKDALDFIRSQRDIQPVTPSPEVGPSARFTPGQYSAGAHPATSPVDVGGDHVPDYTGPTIQPVQPWAPGEISGRPSVGRFDPNQYSSGSAPVRPPVEVGGGHIPDLFPQKPPDRVFHGTSRAFDEFDPSITSEGEFSNLGTFFAEDPQLANRYATEFYDPFRYGQNPNVRPANLKITRPFNLDSLPRHEALALTKQDLINRGYDGAVRMEQYADDEGNIKTGRAWIAFSPDQINPHFPPKPTLPDISGKPTTGRFIPGQYDAPAPRPPAPSGYQSIKPIAPSMVDISASLPDVNPTQGSPVSSPAPTGPIKGVHLPETPAHYAGEVSPTSAHNLDLDVIRELRKSPNFDPKAITIEQVQAARKATGHRPLAAKDIDRRLPHIGLTLNQ